MQETYCEIIWLYWDLLPTETNN
uniref:Uncharacterized protein n=1 Tax=Rhizophora mucronata TaxID=61149 RepID=A0A2P2PB35_RHIMU